MPAPNAESSIDPQNVPSLAVGDRFVSTAPGLSPSERLRVESRLFRCRQRAQAAALLLIAPRVGLDLITAAVSSTSLWTSRVAKPAHRDEHELVVSTSRLLLRALSEIF